MHIIPYIRYLIKAPPYTNCMETTPRYLTKLVALFKNLNMCAKTALNSEFCLNSQRKSLYIAQLQAKWLSL